jgi:hypothetical protein
VKEDTKMDGKTLFGVGSNTKVCHRLHILPFIVLMMTCVDFHRDCGRATILQ